CCPTLLFCGTVLWDSALYVLSAPNLLRVGCTENIFVESQDHTGGPLNVDILVKKFPTQEHLLAIKSVVLDAANNFQSLTQVVIPAKELLVEDPEKKQFVVLQARFPVRLLEKTVLVSFQCGYIFIQTDKTIYTPASTVSYRLFSMNPGLETLSTAIIVEITNPDNIPIHKKSIYINQGVNSEEFKLPEMVNFGTWHVVARFKSNPEKTFSSDFEVKGYVLPSFEVILTPAKPFYNIEDKDLTVSITAKYRHGVNVIGAGYVVFGVITVLNEKKSIPSSLQKVEIREGKGVARLHKDHITQTFTDIKR
uniref:Complement component c3b, tandem duplicate 2 n=1 Tax=Esox lucius TaxID=8010 RepID=A0AAY5K8T8_ESOLU